MGVCCETPLQDTRSGKVRREIKVDEIIISAPKQSKTNEDGEAAKKIDRIVVPKANIENFLNGITEQVK